MNPFKLLFLLLLFFCNNLLANSVLGGSIGYTCKGKGKYTIVAKFYRDCAGAAFNTPVFGAYAGKDGSNACGDVSLNFSRVNIEKIVSSCRIYSASCIPENTANTGIGIEIHTYEATVDFNSAPLNVFTNNSACCEIVFYAKLLKRSNLLTNGAASTDFYMNSMLQICGININSDCVNAEIPDYFPSYYYCSDKSINIIPTITNTLNDSIQFEMVPGLKGIPNDYINYIAPLTAKIPIWPNCSGATPDCTPDPNSAPPKGFYFDNKTGKIICMSKYNNAFCNFVIRCNVYKKNGNNIYQKMGYSTTEIPARIYDSCRFNNAPVLEGPANNVTIEGDKICFKIKCKDETFTPYQTIADTTQMRWNKGISGATFTIIDPQAREKEAEFCWQTKMGDCKKNYFFTVTATDNNCPFPSTTIKQFNIEVKCKAKTNRYYFKNQNNELIFVSAPFNGTPNFIYKWRILDTAGAELKFSTNKIDSIFIGNNKKIIAIHTINDISNAPSLYRDTLFFNQLPMYTKNNLFVTKPFQIYPNPANNMLFIKSENKINKVEIFNSMGQKIHAHLTNNTNVNIEHLCAGNYLIKIEVENKISWYKFTKN